VTGSGRVLEQGHLGGGIRELCDTPPIGFMGGAFLAVGNFVKCREEVPFFVKRNNWLDDSREGAARPGADENGKASKGNKKRMISGFQSGERPASDLGVKASSKGRTKK